MGADPARHLDPAHQRHLNVQHSHVRLVLLDQRAGFLPVACFGDDLDVRVLHQELPDACPHNDVVVGEQNTNHFRELFCRHCLLIIKRNLTFSTAGYKEN